MKNSDIKSIERGLNDLSNGNTHSDEYVRNLISDKIKSFIDNNGNKK